MPIDRLGSISSMNRMPIQSDKRTEVDRSTSNVTEEAQNVQPTTQKNGSSVKNQSEQTEEGKKETIKEPSENHLKSALSVVNSKIRMTNTRCEFEYHEKTKRVSIKVIDKQTDKVVREIPPEETLEMVEKIWELAGLIVDEKR